MDSTAQTSTTLPSKNAAVEAALHKYQEVAKLKLALLLTQLDAAREEMEKFIQFHLEELQSQQETRHLVMELSSRITDHRSRVCQVLCSEPLRHAEVAPLILVGMAADRLLESNFFPGLLEGLLGRLGIAAPGESKPPTSSRKGASRLWSSAMCEAILQVEQREVETPGSAGLPQCLDLHYQVPAVFSDLLFIPSMANAVYKAFKPPGLPKASPSSSATPAKVRKELEADDAETTAMTRPSEATLQTARFELYDKDLPEVKEVRARILSLQEGEEATQEDFDSLPDFQLRWTVDETHPPTVLGEYWINHLDSEGRLAKCKPNAFKYEDEWLPLYTKSRCHQAGIWLGPTPQHPGR